MPRKKTTIFGTYYYQDDKQTIQASYNLSRWKPAMAIEWMLYTRNRITSPLIMKFWNQIAKQINNTLNSIETAKYYSQKDFWGDYKPSRLEMIDIVYTLEDYVAMQQFAD